MYRSFEWCRSLPQELTRPALTNFLDFITLLSLRRIKWNTIPHYEITSYCFVLPPRYINTPQKRNYFQGA
jgi:hypothetical protein